ncbi:MAG: LysR family transcriptional regulator [Pseudomonadota bacterium]|uniref:LysR family transcriptional regulator n=1 Tax=Polaromonas sp. TaxID=1869339 RepID=UPI001804C8E2|nr:LysR family transcriptional regulator [Polaromonas sp.]MBA3592565.1 LysR family transcriptional regulator [Polaromonas sp.]MDQ3271935.1 LysR family transcriptional regulator [Pseudomonadota bacterium]
MTAQTQYKLSAPDLEVVLALVRTQTLAEAGERLAVDASTVFRSLQRIEKGLGQRLFERSRTGYQPLELAQILATHGEQLEVQLESARSAAQAEPEQVSGSVRITTTDTILHGLVAPALKLLQSSHPLLSYDLHAGNELASLTRRDADIAVRATRRPPQHLVGKHVGPIRMAVFGSKKGGPKSFDAGVASKTGWVAPDDALPDHPSVTWRKKHFPKVLPRYRVNSILTVAELVGQGMGIGLLPVFLAQGRGDLRALTDTLDECQTELWLLTHTESRHLRRVSTVFTHLARHMALG